MFVIQMRHKPFKPTRFAPYGVKCKGEKARLHLLQENFEVQEKHKRVRGAQESTREVQRSRIEVRTHEVSHFPP